MSVGFHVREARPGDLDAIVSANALLAAETEGKALSRDTLRLGVETALADPDRLRYWVAERDGTGEVLGQSAVSREWSDWRNGWLWWLQSVYVRADARGAGVFRSLYAHIRSTARNSPDVVGLRLYVEHANENARKTYRALGMVEGGYDVFEEIWQGRPC